MKNVIKIVPILLVTIVLVTGCIENKNKKNETETSILNKINENQINQKEDTENQSIKLGDTVTVDYIVYLNGSVYNTNIEKIAKDNNITYNNRTIPISFKIGKGEAIKGLEEGVIGMKLGESKNFTIPPEKAFQIDPKLISIIPRIEKIRTTRNLSKNFDIPADMFNFQYGTKNVGDVIQILGTNINATIKNISTSNVSLYTNLKVGDIVSAAPFNERVTGIDDNNITLKIDMKKGEIIKWSAWNTTVVDIDSENMTLEHNYIPDTKIRTAYGLARVHFNDTSIIMDLNSELAGKTLIYNVTIKSINRINS